MTESLFSYLATRFSTSSENLATEALSFILNHSTVARDSFINLLSHLHIPILSNLKFETQNYDDNDKAIPDLIGKDSDGTTVLLGEAKFWAGLTNNQPVTYIHRLTQSKGTLLIFFAPSKRFQTLWPELHYRCNRANILFSEQETEISEIKIARIQEKQFLVLISWRSLLNTIYQSLVTEGESEMAGNVHQLQSLCEKMDETAFLPIKSEELTSNNSRRYLQFCDLVDEVTNILVSEKFASVKRLKAQGQRYGYSRYMVINSYATSLEFNTILWSKYRTTPIWLGILGSNWKFDPVAKSELVSLETEEPKRLFLEGGVLYVPIFLEIGLEKSEVVKLMIDQIKDVYKLLSRPKKPVE
ncbi:hypothetical protein ACFLXB_04155 [Chloroflexota bacterium]